LLNFKKGSSEMKRSVLYLFPVLMLAMIVSCGDESSKGDPDDGTPGSNMLSGKINNWSTYLTGKSLTTGSGVFAQVVVLDATSSSQTILAVVSSKSVIASDGSFSLTLLNPESTYLCDVSFKTTGYSNMITSSPSSGVSIFDGSSYAIQICLFKTEAYNTVLPTAADSLGYLDYLNISNNNSAYLDYASKAVSFTGSYDDQSPGSGGGSYTYTNVYDGTKQPKGWCLTYCDVTNITSSSETDTYRYSQTFSQSGYVWSAN
jgi:hypothetical protein